MTRRTWIGLGWLAFVSDAVYLAWTLGQPEDQRPSNWHGLLNVVLYFGGVVLFVVLAILSLLALLSKARTRHPG